MTFSFLGGKCAHIRGLLLQAAARAGLGLRRLTSANLEDSPEVTVSAFLVSASPTMRLSNRSLAGWAWSRLSPPFTGKPNRPRRRP